MRMLEVEDCNWSICFKQIMRFLCPYGLLGLCISTNICIRIYIYIYIHIKCIFFYGKAHQILQVFSLQFFALWIWTPNHTHPSKIKEDWLFGVLFEKCSVKNTEHNPRLQLHRHIHQAFFFLVMSQDLWGKIK